MALRFVLLLAVCVQVSLANWGCAPRAFPNYGGHLNLGPAASPYIAGLTASAPGWPVPSTGFPVIQIPAPAERNAWNTPAAIPAIPNVNTAVSSLGNILGALSPWKTPAAVPGAPSNAAPWATAAENPWNRPAAVPTYVACAAPGTPVDANWIGWSGQNAHTWNLPAVIPTIAAAEATAPQLPAPIQLPSSAQLPAPTQPPAPTQLPAAPQQPAAPQLPAAPHLPITPQIIESPQYAAGPPQYGAPIYPTHAHNPAHYGHRWHY